MNTPNAENTPSVEQVVIPKKSHKEIVLEAQQELRSEINALRRKTSNLLDELAQIGGVDAYEDVVLAFVNEAGAKGITVAKIHTVLPDSVALTKARNTLVTNGKIKAEKDGVTFLLTPMEGTLVAA